MMYSNQVLEAWAHTLPIPFPVHAIVPDEKSELVAFKAAGGDANNANQTAPYLGDAQNIDQNYGGGGETGYGQQQLGRGSMGKSTICICNGKKCESFGMEGSLFSNRSHAYKMIQWREKCIFTFFKAARLVMQVELPRNFPYVYYS